MRDSIVSSPFRAKRFAAVFVGLGILAASLGLGCAADGTGDGPQSTLPWDQTVATQAAGALKAQFSTLYSSALKQPSFAGERSEYGNLLDQLRILQEESNGLYAKLSDGKGRAETLTSWERIREVSRDAQESASWQFIPEDFANEAKAALASTEQLNAMYGTR